MLMSSLKSTALLMRQRCTVSKTLLVSQCVLRQVAAPSQQASVFQQAYRQFCFQSLLSQRICPSPSFMGQQHRTFFTLNSTTAATLLGNRQTMLMASMQ